MLDRLERDLFRRELKFLKMLRGKITDKEVRFVKMIDDQIDHLESILQEETDHVIND
ncbi:hypothetical protein [Bacillus sp. JCM 19041]|uniref:hypothetical protein n=1 Tax=Bacillus sp. JCM 19041 TaxID=1460637 RepID=UPI000AC0C24C